MLHLKFKKSFYEATPHLSEPEVHVLTKKLAATVKHKELVQVDADAYLDIFPDSPSKWQAFCDYLENTGQLDPILVDADGYVMDGFSTWFALSQQKDAAKDILTKVITHLKADADKITWIRSRKLARANLTETQRMELVEAEIKAHPELNSNFQAQRLGVDHKTVTKYRQKLEDLGPKDGGIKWYDTLLGANGRKDKNPGTKPVANSKRRQSADSITNDKHEKTHEEAAQEPTRKRQHTLQVPTNGTPAPPTFNVTTQPITYFHHDCHSFQINGNSLQCLDQQGQTVTLVAPKQMPDLLRDALVDKPADSKIRERNVYTDCHNFQVDRNSLQCLDQQGQTVVLVVPNKQRMGNILKKALVDKPPDSQVRLVDKRDAGEATEMKPKGIKSQKPKKQPKQDHMNGRRNRK